MLDRLVIDDLAVTRGGRRLFERLSLEVVSGQAMALTGANGSGKTSLLRAIAGLLRPAAGRIAFHNGEAPLDPEVARSSALHLLGHADGLKSGRTAGEELEFWTSWLGGDAAKGVRSAVEALDLGPLLPLEVRKLSAGQRRRLALGRLVAAPRPLWLLDEPLAPLDASQRQAVGALMASHLAGGGMIVAAVHDPLPVPTRQLAVDAGSGRVAA